MQHTLGMAERRRRKLPYADLSEAPKAHQERRQEEERREEDEKG